MKLAQRNHSSQVTLKLVFSLIGSLVLFYLLRGIPRDLLRQEFEGFAVAFCALVCGGFLLSRVILALQEDAMRPESLVPSRK